ncbi:hypothetical protein EGR_01617 [Echinococcus granulosus]|uniref:DUF5726 domain-containing protein n=1 Tax=Echinococcus granulosus TaxID=6210 RepID=W6UPH0_ECHGR|nr:hypothetical protein EGR_01617 [Echinococcus granulosus]EUB63535.1 hypothetical protein EGR_01617 [Echinococcus granulosus]
MYAGTLLTDSSVFGRKMSEGTPNSRPMSILNGGTPIGVQTVGLYARTRPRLKSQSPSYASLVKAFSSPIRLRFVLSARLKTTKEFYRSFAPWYEELQQYDFTVQYRKGKGHGNTDALSHRQTPAETGNVIVCTIFPSDLPSFGNDVNFEDCLKTAKFNLFLYSRSQRIPLIRSILPNDLFLATVDAGITHDNDIDQCCDTLAQLVIDGEEQTLARDFFLRFQKAGKNDEEYSTNLRHLAERAKQGR